MLKFPQGVREVDVNCLASELDAQKAVQSADASTVCRCQECGYQVPLSHIRQELPHDTTVAVTDFKY